MNKDNNQDIPNKDNNTEKQQIVASSDFSHAVIHIDLPPGGKINIIIEDLNGTGYTETSQIIHSKSSGSTSSKKAISTVSSNLNSTQKNISGNIKEHIGVWKQKLPSIQLATTLFALGLAVYLLTRLIGLTQFPIFFFTDEAIPTVLASDFIRDGFRSYDNELFPTFFKNNTLYCLSTSVYLQIIPYLLFGKSIFVTRATAMIATLLAAYWVSKIARDIFKSTYWWSAALLLSITPTWFLHSRTAFEYCLLVTFYAGFIYYYLLYRTNKPRNLYPALIFGSLAFYSYMPGQIIMVVSGVLLLLWDWKYHWENRKTALRGLGVLTICILPLVRFMITHSDEFSNRLTRYHSYWTASTTTGEKILFYLSEYIKGFNPIYWFTTESNELLRHFMLGYGHILWPFFPLMLIGLIVIIIRHHRNIARPIIVALLAAPSGAATIAMGITRALVMVIPIIILTTLGLTYSLDWLKKRDFLKLSSNKIAIILFLILAGFNSYMTYDAITNGPTWFTNYGLGGMQYGAKQVFSEAKKYLQDDPNIKMDISPNWTNGANIVALFFFDPPLPFEMRSIDGYFNEYHPIDENQLFIMTKEEYQKTIESKRFVIKNIDQIIEFPDGTPGFYFVRLQYVDNIEEVFSEIQEERRKLIEENITIDGQKATIKYSALDMGEIINIFDGDENSIARSLEANPMVIQLAFEKPIEISSLEARVGGGPTGISVDLFPTDEEEPLNYSVELEAVPKPRTAKLEFDSSITVTNLEIKVENLDTGEPSHVHLWEISLNK